MHMTSPIIIEQTKQTKKCEKTSYIKCKAMIKRNELQIVTYKNRDLDIL